MDWPNFNLIRQLDIVATGGVTVPPHAQGRGAMFTATLVDLHSEAAKGDARASAYSGPMADGTEGVIARRPTAGNSPPSPDHDAEGERALPDPATEILAEFTPHTLHPPRAPMHHEVARPPRSDDPEANEGMSQRVTLDDAGEMTKAPSSAGASSLSAHEVAGNFSATAGVGAGQEGVEVSTASLTLGSVSDDFLGPDHVLVPALPAVGTSAVEAGPAPPGGRMAAAHGTPDPAMMLGQTAGPGIALHAAGAYDLVAVPALPHLPAAKFPAKLAADMALHGRSMPDSPLIQIIERGAPAATAMPRPENPAPPVPAGAALPGPSSSEAVLHGLEGVVPPPVVPEASVLADHPDLSERVSEGAARSLGAPLHGVQTPAHVALPSGVLAAPVPSDRLPRMLPQIARTLPDGPVELRLAPTELGRILLTMQADGERITVLVQAERPETADLLRRSADILQQEMRQAGFGQTAFSFQGGHTDHPAHDQTAMPDAAVSDGPAPDPADAGPGGAPAYRFQAAKGRLYLRL